MVSLTSPGWSVRSTTSCCPTTNVTPVFTSDLNPLISAVTSYRPRGKEGRSYRPDSLVMTFLVNPFSRFLTLTVAPAMTAPELSVMTPAIDASTCAKTGIASEKRRRDTRNSFQDVLRANSDVFSLTLIQTLRLNSNWVRGFPPDQGIHGTTRIPQKWKLPGSALSLWILLGRVAGSKRQILVKTALQRFNQLR